MSRQFWANLALCVLLGALTIFAVTRMGSALTPKGLLVGEPEPSAEAATLLPHVRLIDYKLRQVGEHEYRANFHIRNNSEQDVKNIRVLCEFADNRNSYADRKWWLVPEKVYAGGEVVFSAPATRRFISSRARIGRADCRIADFQLATEPLFTLEQVAAAGHGSSPADGHGQGSGGGH